MCIRDRSLINALEIVENVVRIQEPYKKVNRKFHPEDTVITLENGTKIGGGNFVIMAGPCSVETEEQVIETAKHVKASGANVLRGGAFKPRSSPYSFQGLGAKGIEILLKAKEVTGLPIVTEIMEPKQIIYFEHVDIIQVGARNMQNFELLKVPVSYTHLDVYKRQEIVIIEVHHRSIKICIPVQRVEFQTCS